MRCHAPGYVFAAALLASSCGGDGTPTSMSQGSDENTQVQPDAQVSGQMKPDANQADASGGELDANSQDMMLDASTAPDSALPKDPEPPIVNQPSATEQLLGHYAMRQRSAATAAALGTTYKSVATSYMLVNIVARDGKVLWAQRGCKSEVENDPQSTTVSIADAVPRTTPALEVELSARTSGDVIEWERAQASVGLGFHDRDPAQPLPTDKNDARVYDQDNDGKPGVTVHIRAKLPLSSIEGDTYNAQRLHSRLRGSFDGEHLLGEVFETTETRVLESTHPALALTLSPKRDDKGDNSVLLVKVTQSLSCDELVQRIDQLF